MRRPKRLFRIVILCSAMASVSMGLATSAHAISNWLVGGAVLKTNKNVLLKSDGNVGLVVPALNIEFRCAVLSSNGFNLIGQSGEAWGVSAASVCDAYSPPGTFGVLQKNCRPKEPIFPDVKAILIAHESKSYVLLKPDIAKSQIATIVLSELCALAETSEVKGSTVLECGQLVSFKFVGGSCQVAYVVHSIRPAPAELFSSDKLKFGENAATIIGVAEAELESKESWAGDA